MAHIRVNQKVLVFVICFLLTFILVGVLFYKPPLKNATRSELDVYGVGDVLMARIENYINENPDARVEDLREIKGVDRMITDQLKRRYR